MDDWSDPFADDEAARERERRRAERDARRGDRRARRAEQQSALADRVRGMMGRARTDGATADPRLDSPPAARAAAAEPPSPPEPPPRALGPREPPPPPPPRQRNLRRRRLVVAAIVVVIAIGIVAGAAAVIHRYTAGDSTTGPPKRAGGGAKSITIPEGYDRHQISDLAKQDGLKGDYVKASESFKGFNTAKYGVKSPPNLEGFLFPATYDLPRHPSVNDLIARQLAAFKQYFSRVDLSYAKSKNLTPYDVLTIASMIEREAIVEKDRPLIAAVIYNRLSQGIPLGIDATIRFAENNWTKPLTESDLSIHSPYNTRENTGLPPTPIGNPGLASIKAAARPAKVDYLYYVAKPNGCGHFFTASYQAFLQASDRYNSAREAAGGKSPAHCQ